MATFLGRMLSMMPDTISAQPGTIDEFGGFTAVGAPIDIRCYISGKTNLVREIKGKEVKSTIKAILNGVNSLTVEGFRFDLPARFNPRLQLRAITIDRPTDESGPHHETIFFP